VVPASATVKAGFGDTLTADIGTGFAGDKVEFVGFENGASVGQVIGTTTAGTDTAASSWTPIASEEGSWSITALLFPPGDAAEPYAAVTRASVTVEAP
jgi:hypothetical protein